MGHMNALGMAEAVEGGDIDLRNALHWHLTANHYPPIRDPKALDLCVGAIEAANEGDWDAEIFLPDGITYKGQFTAPVWAIVEQHHLDAFIREENE